MTRYAADLETNGLLYSCSKIHCACLVDIDSDYQELFINNEESKELWDRFLGIISSPDNMTIWHNGFGFDLLVLKKLYSIELSSSSRVHDTFVLGQLLFGDIKSKDFGTFKVPGKLIGKHSLEAWGHRLECHKGVYTGGFEVYNDDMGIYCLQDGQVTKTIFKYFETIIDQRTWK